ncbi:hypothetical protein [Streptomyces sp. NPDC054849]
MVTHLNRRAAQLPADEGPTGARAPPSSTWDGYEALYPLATAARTRRIRNAAIERLRRGTEV